MVGKPWRLAVTNLAESATFMEYSKYNLMRFHYFFLNCIEFVELLVKQMNAYIFS